MAEKERHLAGRGNTLYQIVQLVDKAEAEHLLRLIYAKAFEVPHVKRTAFRNHIQHPPRSSNNNLRRGASREVKIGMHACSANAERDFDSHVLP